MRHVWYFFLIIILFCGCKERPTRHQKAQPQYDIEKVSQNISQYTKVSEVPLPEAVPKEEPRHKVIDLSGILQETNAVEFKPERMTLSQFSAVSEPQCVRVSIAIKGMNKKLQDDIEDRIWSILTSHAPEPWELNKSSSADGREKCSSRLNVEFKRQILRLKKASKTAAQRAELKFSFSMSFSAPQGMKASWNGWKLDYQDEVAVANENSVNTVFWQKLGQSFPTLTVISSDETAQWLRTQGLSAQILDSGLEVIRSEAHHYYPSGCLLSKDDVQGLSLRQILSPYSPPQRLEISNIIDMVCTREATFVVSGETPVRMALYYQPVRSEQAWKSQLSFSDGIRPGDLELHVDDDLVCLYTRGDSIQNRGVEIQCLDRRTGLIRWQSKRFPGALRGIAFDDKQVVFANDQAIFAISRAGELLYSQRIQTSPRLRVRQFCQLRNRLIFMTGPGQFVSWNLDSNSFDWKAGVLESGFIHCGQQDTLLFSEVGGYILAYDVGQNKPLWKFRTVSDVRDAFSYGDMIYLLLERAVIVLDRSTGRRKAQVPLPWPVTGFIQIGPKLYFDAPDAVYRWR